MESDTLFLGNKMKKALFLVFILLIPISGWGLSTEQLVLSCESNNSLAIAACVIYVKGYVTGALTFAFSDINFPSGVSYKEYSKRYVSWVYTYTKNLSSQKRTKFYSASQNCSFGLYLAMSMGNIRAKQNAILNCSLDGYHIPYPK